MQDCLLKASVCAVCLEVLISRSSKVAVFFIRVKCVIGVKLSKSIHGAGGRAEIFLNLRLMHEHQLVFSRSHEALVSSCAVYV